MMMSPTIGELAQALAKAQGAMSSAKKTASNPFFKSKYAPLSSIVDAIKAPLSSNGLAYTQTTEIGDDSAVIIETVLLHVSGEWISGKLRMMPAKTDPQGVGSCITYARRYGLQAIVGIDADNDDDGNASTGADREVEVKNAIQETAKDRFDPRAPRRTASPVTPTHDAAFPDGIAMASESAKIQAAEMKAQSAKPATNPDVLPADPAAIVAAFDARVNTIPRPAWADDATQVAQKGVQLAQNLRTNGMKDAQRKHLYSLLTGMDSSKDMTPQQLALLFANSGTQGTKRLLALLEWTEEQAQAELV